MEEKTVKNIEKGLIVALIIGGAIKVATLIDIFDEAANNPDIQENLSSIEHSIEQAAVNYFEEFGTSFKKCEKAVISNEIRLSDLIPCIKDRVTATQTDSTLETNISEP